MKRDKLCRIAAQVKRSSRLDLTPLYVFDVSVDFLKNCTVDARGLNHDERASLYPFVLVWMLDLGESAGQTVFAHDFFWPIFLPESSEVFSHFSPNERQTLWGALEFVYDEIFKLKEDEYWVTEKLPLRDRLLKQV